MEALGFYLKQQVMDRHETQGESGGEPWQSKKIKEWGYDDGRAILTGKSAEMLNRWFSYAEVEGNIGTAVVANSAPYSYVQELGTVGKGGVLPDIVPVNAKALFIPITDKGISYAKNVLNVARISRGIGGVKFSLPNEIPSGPKAKGILSGSDLIKGRLKDGKLQKLTDAGWVDGTPDFIFLSKSSIPPRKQLPTSPQERLAQQKFLISET